MNSFVKFLATNPYAKTAASLFVSGVFYAADQALGSLAPALQSNPIVGGIALAGFSFAHNWLSKERDKYLKAASNVTGG